MRASRSRHWGALRRYCDTTQTRDQCAGCDGDFGSGQGFACTNPSLPACVGSGADVGYCVECTDDSFCGGTAPICDTTRYHCEPAGSGEDSGSGSGSDEGSGSGSDEGSGSASGSGSNEGSGSGSDADNTLDGGGCSVGGGPSAIVPVLFGLLALARKRRRMNPELPVD